MLGPTPVGENNSQRDVRQFHRTRTLVHETYHDVTIRIDRERWPLDWEDPGRDLFGKLPASSPTAPDRDEHRHRLAWGGGLDPYRDFRDQGIVERLGRRKTDRRAGSWRQSQGPC